MAQAEGGVNTGPQRRPSARLPATGRYSADLVSCYRLARAHRSEGGLFCRLISDPLGSWVAAVGIRRGIHPSVVTLSSLVLAITASAIVIAHADQAHGLWFPGLAALVGWQLAYVFDCADGQMARATGKQSEFGARLDVLVDFCSQASTICALVTVIAHSSGAPISLLAVSCTLWTVNLLVFSLARADGNLGHSFTSRRNGVVGVIKLIRDTGFLLFVIGWWLLISPSTIAFPVFAITLVNGLFILASIGREGLISMRRA
jgi:phosphatidylglycerophosphate synthase